MHSSDVSNRLFLMGISLISFEDFLLNPDQGSGFLLRGVQGASSVSKLFTRVEGDEL